MSAQEYKARLLENLVSQYRGTPTENLPDLRSTARTRGICFLLLGVVMLVIYGFVLANTSSDVVVFTMFLVMFGGVGCGAYGIMRLMVLPPTVEQLASAIADTIAAESSRTFREPQQGVVGAAPISDMTEFQRHAQESISVSSIQPEPMPNTLPEDTLTGSSRSAVDPRWKAVLDRYGQHISISGSKSKDPIDNMVYHRIRLHTFFRDYAHADLVLSRIPNEIMVLDPVAEGMSRLTGQVKYHVTHEGKLTGRQIKLYLEIVVEGGGGIWEALL